MTGPAFAKSCILSLSLSLFFVPIAVASSSTTTSIAMTAHGSPVASGSSVNARTPITLTAKVASGSTAVTVGQVRFCDASAPSCTDIHLVGMAQLTASGTAAVTMTPPNGAHTYKAIFSGTPNGSPSYSGSSSATETLTVTGAYPSAIQIAEVIPPPYTYDLDVSVSSVAPIAPTGTVSIVNTSNGNAVLGAATLGNPTAKFRLSTIDPRFYSMVGQETFKVAVGDFNGDGIPDVALVTSKYVITGRFYPPEVVVALGDGTGHFTAAPVFLLPESTTIAALNVGDFNGDGKLDLAVASLSDSSIIILLGNGDGSLTQHSTVPTGGTFDFYTAYDQFAVADLNSDGILDIAVLNESAALLTVFLGHGDGTFTASAAAPTPTGVNPVGLVTADFNGDGISDLACISSVTPSVLDIFLGNGDGTFKSSTVPFSEDSTFGIATGDFNGDGFVDIAVSSTLFLGNGDGTFKTPAPITNNDPDLQHTPLSAGDVNADGKLDIIAQRVFIGNGDGTFTKSLYSVGLVPADLNMDGATDQIGFGVGLAVTQTATATATGIALPPATGSANVAASYMGDSANAPSTSDTVSLDAAPGTPSVTLSANPNPANAGTPVVFTASVTGGGLAITGSVSFFDGSANLGNGTLNSGGVATYSTSALSVGSHIITASYTGDSNHTAASSSPLSVKIAAVGSAAPTITVTPSSTSITSAQPLDVSVTVAGPSGGATPTGSVVLSSGSYTATQTLVSGASTFTVPAGSLADGAQTLTAAYYGDPAYAIGTATAPVSVSEIVLTVPAPSPVNPGATAATTVSIATGAGYSGTLSLTCALTSSPSGAQSLPVCSLNPASVTVKTAAIATSTLSIATSAASGSAAVSPSNGLRGFGAASTVLAGLLLCGVARRRRKFLALVVLAWTLTAIGVTACGGSSKPTPAPGTPATTAGSYTFTVTATDASKSTTTSASTVTITVN